MSTAGKVLIVLIMLGTVVWMALTSGVAQLNRNHSKVLHDLEVQYEDLGNQLDQTRTDVSALRDEIGSTQEKSDVELTVLREKVAELEKHRSQIVESLTRWQFQVATLGETLKGARDTLAHRNEEQKAEEKALADTKAEVQTLMAESSQLMDRLKNLRGTFQSTYGANRAMLK
jgi:chromosome segregation ATPase